MDKHNIRCSYCGKFISYDDLKSKRIGYNYIPDSDRSIETHEYYHIMCKKKYRV